MRAFFATVVIAACVPTTSFAADEVIGAVWKVEIVGEKSGEWSNFIHFRALKTGKIVGGPKQAELGSYTQKGDEIVIKLTKLGGPRASANGTYTVTKINKDGSKWQGEFVDSDGKASAVRVTLVKD